MDPCRYLCRNAKLRLYFGSIFSLGAFLPNDSVTLSEELRHVTTKIILSRKLRLPSSRCRSRWSRAATWRSKEPWRTRWPPTWTCRTRLASTSPSRSWRMPPKVKYSWVKPKLLLVKLTWLFRSHCFYNGPSSILRDVPEIPCVPDIFLLDRFDLS